MGKTVYLVRHGTIDTGDERRYIGSTELSLCEKGRSDGESLGEFFREILIDYAYISPMKRCVETAELIFRKKLSVKEMPYELREELREIHMGEWEGKLMKEIQLLYPDAFSARGEALDTFRPPIGESFQDVLNRAMIVLRTIWERPEENILLLSHSGVNRALLSAFSGASLKDLMKLEVPYGSVYRLHFSEHRNCDRIERIK